MPGRYLWMTAPAVAVILLLFCGGLALAIAQSVPAFGRVLTDAEFFASLSITFRVAAIATVISAMLALPVALVAHERRGGLLHSMLQIPIAAPHVSLAVALIYALAPTGLFARVLYSIGLVQRPDAFPQFINDRYGVGIVLLYVLKEMPFLAMLCLSVLTRADPDYHSAARTLGASTWQRMRYVTLPLVAPALGAGSVVVFAFVFSAFDAPFLLGRPYPAMIGVLAQRKFMSMDLRDRPEALAIALAGTVVALLALAVALRLRKRVAVL